MHSTARDGTGPRESGWVLTDIGKLSIFENDKVELFGQLDKLVNEGLGEIIDDIAVCLRVSGYVKCVYRVAH